MENVLPALMVHSGMLFQVLVIHALIPLFTTLIQKNVYVHQQLLSFKIISALLVQLNKFSIQTHKDAKVVHQMLHCF
jgi:hypothetical protein